MSGPAVQLIINGRRGRRSVDEIWIRSAYTGLLAISNGASNLSENVVRSFVARTHARTHKVHECIRMDNQLLLISGLTVERDGAYRAFYLLFTAELPARPLPRLSSGD